MSYFLLLCVFLVPNPNIDFNPTITKKTMTFAKKKLTTKKSLPGGGTKLGTTDARGARYVPLCKKCRKRVAMQKRVETSKLDLLISCFYSSADMHGCGKQTTNK